MALIQISNTIKEQYPSLFNLAKDYFEFMEPLDLPTINRDSSIYRVKCKGCKCDQDKRVDLVLKGYESIEIVKCTGEGG